MQKKATKKTDDSTAVQGIVLKNKHIGTFTKLGVLFKLLNVPLHGDISRSRNHFLKNIETKREEIEAERVKIMESHAKKETKSVDGKDVDVPVINEQNQYDIDAEGLVKANEEYRNFMEEKYVVDVLPSTLFDLKNVKDVILTSKVTFTSEDGEEYDEIATAFEVVK